jgi:hypothetical protein
MKNGAIFYKGSSTAFNLPGFRFDLESSAIIRKRKSVPTSLVRQFVTGKMKGAMAWKSSLMKSCSASMAP